MKYVLKNATIFTSEKILTNKMIIISDGFIEAITNAEHFDESYEVIDLEGLTVAPGFIDLQVNGGGGVLFNNDLTAAAIYKIAEAHMQFGTTNCLITLISPSEREISEGLKATNEAMQSPHLGVLGIHIEGPFIAPQKRGIHPQKHIRTMTQRELLTIIQKSDHTIKMMTVAPEMVDETLIRTMSKNQIVVSLGHSDCTFMEATTAFRAGATKVTHLFNAMSPLGSREPGLVGAALLEKNVWCSIIPDGHHVNFETLKLAYQLKKERMLIVTDAMSPVGSEKTTFTLGDDFIKCDNGKCVNANGTLAGSHLNMMEAVKNCVVQLNIPLDEALRMCSTYPAEVIHMNDRLGKIKMGYLANLTIFNDEFNVRAVIVNGKLKKY